MKKALPALVCLVLLTPHIWTDKPASASAPPDPRFGAVEAYEAPDYQFPCPPAPLPNPPRRRPHLVAEAALTSYHLTMDHLTKDMKA